MADFSNAKITVFLKSSSKHSKFLPQGQLFRNTTTKAALKKTSRAACCVGFYLMSIRLLHVDDEAHRAATAADIVGRGFERAAGDAESHVSATRRTPVVAFLSIVLWRAAV